MDLLRFDNICLVFVVIIDLSSIKSPFLNKISFNIIPFLYLGSDFNFGSGTTTKAEESDLTFLDKIASDMMKQISDQLHIEDEDTLRKISESFTQKIKSQIASSGGSNPQSNRSNDDYSIYKEKYINQKKQYDDISK